MSEPIQPVLPATPWWDSEVQLRLVIGGGFQVLSIVLRLIGRYMDVPVTTEDLDLLAADVSQMVAVVFGILAVTKRAQSPVQPLTLTQARADEKIADNPPMLESNPTKEKP